MSPQVLLSHLFTHRTAFSLNSARSDAEHGSSSSRSGHLRRYWTVSSSVPHSQRVLVLAGWGKPYFFMALLVRATPERRRFKHFQARHSALHPGGRASAGSMKIPDVTGDFASLSCHICSLVCSIGCSRGEVEYMKLFLDFSRTFAGWWLYSK